jgi:ubiquinone/menaquinone biosynthesis C-methylase UbiE
MTMTATGLRDAKPAKEFAVYWDKACIICGSPIAGAPIGQVREHEYVTTDREFPAHQCPKCGLVFLYPRPDVSELPTLYAADYYSNNLNLDGKDDQQAKSFVQGLFYKIHTKNYRERVLPFLPKLADNRPYRILDVGCGVGAQLDAIKSLLPNCETYGVEYGSVAAGKARGRGHTVYEGRFEDLDLPQGYFDAIISIHVIEHVARPDLFLEKCVRLATAEGFVMIETPNTDCVDFDLLKRRHWGGYHTPRHWYLFRKETVEALAQRLGCNLVTCRPYTMSNFWAWSAHSLATEAIGRKPADLLFPPVKILYGGLQSFVILSFFAVVERMLLAATGRACSLWFVVRRGGGVSANSAQRA